MADHDPFIAAIRANPDDDAPRLIYADWLEDRNPAWADYIRRECGAAESQNGPVASRKKLRFNDPAREAIRRLRQEVNVDGLADVRLRRGFIEGVRFWRLDDVEQQLAALHLSPLVSVITEFKVLDRDADDAGLARLLASPWLVHLQSLELRGHRLTAECARIVAASTQLSCLKRLAFAYIAIGDDGLRALAESPVIQSLEELDCFSARIGDSGVVALAGSSYFRGIRALRLFRNDVTDAAIEALVASVAFRSITLLNVGENPIGDAGVWNLFRSPNCVLEQLHGSMSNVGDKGVIALANSPRAARLQRLHLMANSIGDRGAFALAASPFLKQLRELALASNGLSLEGHVAFANSSSLPELFHLTLSGLDDVAALAFVNATSLPKLRVLTLFHEAMSHEVHAAIAGRYQLNVQ